MTIHVEGYRTPPLADVKTLLARSRGMALARADRVYGRDHLLHAATLAKRAVDEDRARTADVATETMLYAAGERQIGKALAFLGINEATRAVAVAAWEDPTEFAAREGWTRDDAVLDGDASVLDAFGVSAEERAMLPRDRWGDLVLERVALTDVLKS